MLEVGNELRSLVNLRRTHSRLDEKAPNTYNQKDPVLDLSNTLSTLNSNLHLLLSIN